MPSDNPAILDAREVGGLLNMTEWQVRDWARAGIIPHYRNGRRVLFHRAEVLDWYEHGRRREQPVAAPVPADLGQLLLAGEVELVITVRRKPTGGK